jgi:hypothetical protein
VYDSLHTANNNAPAHLAEIEIENPKEKKQ